MFIEDMFDIYEDVPHEFDLGVQIHLLYKDFMTQIKKGDVNKQVAGFLLSGKEQFSEEKKIEKRVMKALTHNLFTLSP